MHSRLIVEYNVQDGDTPLHYAVRGAHHHMVVVLLKKGADLMARNKVREGGGGGGGMKAPRDHHNCSLFTFSGA